MLRKRREGFFPAEFMAKPRIANDPMYLLLREGAVQEFNQRRAKGEACDLTGCDLSRLDLRELNAEGLNLADCYFRMTDLRGVDLRSAMIEGASFAAANISGTFFPKAVSAAEIDLSVRHGTRVRCD
jgi:uncharacterized protein YjbI with pentapeptide repeats